MPGTKRKLADTNIIQNKKLKESPPLTSMYPGGLPRDIWGNIFPFLNIKGLQTVAQVCKTFNEIIKNNFLAKIHTREKNYAGNHSIRPLPIIDGFSKLQSTNVVLPYNRIAKINFHVAGENQTVMAIILNIHSKKQTLLKVKDPQNKYKTTAIASFKNGDLVTSSTDHMLRIWDGTTGKCKAEWKDITNKSISAIQILPNQNIITIAKSPATLVRGQVTFWNSRTTKIEGTFTGAYDPKIRIFPDGNILIEDSEYKNLFALDGKTFSLVRHRYIPNNMIVIKIQPDNSILYAEQQSKDLTSKLVTIDYVTNKIVKTYNNDIKKVQKNNFKILENGDIAVKLTMDTEDLMVIVDGTNFTRKLPFRLEPFSNTHISALNENDIIVFEENASKKSCAIWSLKTKKPNPIELNFHLNPIPPALLQSGDVMLFNKHTKEYKLLLFPEKTADKPSLMEEDNKPVLSR